MDIERGFNQTRCYAAGRYAGADNVNINLVNLTSVAIEGLAGAEHTVIDGRQKSQSFAVSGAATDVALLKGLPPTLAPFLRPDTCGRPTVPLTILCLAFVSADSDRSGAIDLSAKPSFLPFLHTLPPEAGPCLEEKRRFQISCFELYDFAGSHTSCVLLLYRVYYYELHI